MLLAYGQRLYSVGASLIYAVIVGCYKHLQQIDVFRKFFNWSPGICGQRSNFRKMAIPGNRIFRKNLSLRLPKTTKIEIARLCIRRKFANMKKSGGAVKKISIWLTQQKMKPLLPMHMGQTCQIQCQIYQTGNEIELNHGFVIFK